MKALLRSRRVQRLLIRVFLVALVGVLQSRHAVHAAPVIPATT